MARRNDSVYFFVLVDFLVTCLFLGVVLLATGPIEKADIEKIRGATGISDLTELTDELTRLGPMTEAHAAVAAVRRLGGIERVRELTDSMSLAKRQDSLLKLAGRPNGAGKPHCHYDLSRGRQAAIAIALLEASDSVFHVVESSTTLDSLLRALGISQHSDSSWRFRQFRDAFMPLASRPCLFTVRLREKTDFKHARDALLGIFYVRFVR